MLVQVSAKSSQGSEPFDWKTCNNTKKQYYEVESLGVWNIFGKMQVMVVCMQYAVPYEWTAEQNRQPHCGMVRHWLHGQVSHYGSFTHWTRLPKCPEDNCHSETMSETELHLRILLHLSTYSICLEECCFLFKGIPCLQGNYLKEIKSFLKMAVPKNMSGRLSSIKGW